MVWYQYYWHFIFDLCLFYFILFLQVMESGFVCEHHPVFISASFLCKRFYFVILLNKKLYLNPLCIFPFISYYTRWQFINAWQDRYLQDPLIWNALPVGVRINAFLMKLPGLNTHHFPFFFFRISPYWLSIYIVTFTKT